MVQEKLNYLHYKCEVAKLGTEATEPGNFLSGKRETLCNVAKLNQGCQ
jgi:hypothetical protein